MKHYKLAHNFNQVEFDMPDDVPADLAVEILQQEYDILASIEVKGQTAPAIPPAYKKNAAAPVEKASEKQIEWAKNLGMKDAEKKSKKEVWAFIQSHKNA